MDLVNGNAFDRIDLRQGEWPWLMPILANIENKIQTRPAPCLRQGAADLNPLRACRRSADLGGDPGDPEALETLLRLLF